jgi:hypothetical protein
LSASLILVSGHFPWSSSVANFVDSLCIRGEVGKSGDGIGLSPSLILVSGHFPWSSSLANFVDSISSQGEEEKNGDFINSSFSLSLTLDKPALEHSKYFDMTARCMLCGKHFTRKILIGKVKH